MLWGLPFSVIPNDVQSRLNDSPHLLRLGRLFSETVLLEVDGAEFYLTFRDGRLDQIAEGPSRKTPWRFALRTDAEVGSDIERVFGQAPREHILPLAAAIVDFRRQVGAAVFAREHPAGER